MRKSGRPQPTCCRSATSITRAFSSESLPRTGCGVDTGSREENASKQELEPPFRFGTEKALARRANRLRSSRHRAARIACGGQKSPQRKLKFRKTIQSDLGRPVLPDKNISLPFRPRLVATCRYPALTKRGASRSSRTLGAGCDGRDIAADECWCRGRRNRVVLAPRRWR
jgi:hypothetical protein